MLDIERGNVVGEQHDFVAEEIMLILVFQAMVGNAMQEVYNVAACTNAGVNDLYTWFFYRGAEFASAIPRLHWHT